MAALQQDPKKAMETYADVPEMRPYTVQPHAAPCNPLPPRTHLCRPLGAQMKACHLPAISLRSQVPEMKAFLVKFMGLMGEHFTALADAAPPAAAAPVQPVTPAQLTPTLALALALALSQALTLPLTQTLTLRLTQMLTLTLAPTLTDQVQPVQPVVPVQPVSEEEQRVQEAMQDPEVVAYCGKQGPPRFGQHGAEQASPAPEDNARAAPKCG